MNGIISRECCSAILHKILSFFFYNFLKKFQKNVIDTPLQIDSLFQKYRTCCSCSKSGTPCISLLIVKGCISEVCPRLMLVQYLSFWALIYLLRTWTRGNLLWNFLLHELYELFSHINIAQKKTAAQVYILLCKFTTVNENIKQSSELSWGTETQRELKHISESFAAAVIVRDKQQQRHNIITWLPTSLLFHLLFKACSAVTCNFFPPPGEPIEKDSVLCAVWFLTPKDTWIGLSITNTFKRTIISVLNLSNKYLCLQFPLIPFLFFLRME